MKKSYRWAIELFVIILIVSCQPVFATIDVEMILNNGGFVSFDHFKAELYLFNHVATVPDAWIFGILEVAGEFYYWPDFETVVSYRELVIEPGESYLTFLEFDFPDIDDVIPYGPMNFWGAWYVDTEYYGYDVKEFWLDEEHKWTPTPMATFTPEPTETPVLPTSTPTNTPLPPTITPTPSPTPTGFIMFNAGSFTMGSPPSQPCRISLEMQHQVTLTRGFYMMQTEVTRQMWADLKAIQPTLPDDPSDTEISPTMNHPVQFCTWYESTLFANLMSLQYGLTRCYYKDAEFTTPVDVTNYTTETFYCNFTANGFRLPTEAEWEYSCRAETTWAFSCDELNYTSQNCELCISGTHPTLEQYCVYCANGPNGTEFAGSKLSNPAGLYDMHGNVMEWCWDCYGNYPSGSVTDPTGAGSGYRIPRGGSYKSNARQCRSAVRSWCSADERFDHIGFRLVRTRL